MYKIYDADVYYGFFIELKDLIPFMDEDWQKEYNEMLKIEDEVERADEKYRLVDDYLAGSTPLEKDDVKYDVQILPIDMYKFYDIDYDKKKDVLVIGILYEHLKNPSVLDLMYPFRQEYQDKLHDIYSFSKKFGNIITLFGEKILQEAQVIVVFEQS